MSKQRFWLIILIVALGSLILGAMLHRHRAGIMNLIPARTAETTALSEALPVDLDTLKIIIKPEDYAVLGENRTTALKAGVLRDTHRDKVKGKLVVNGDTMKIKLRLKGDLQDHWSHENQWSFRVWIRGNNAYDGITKFEFQRPERRKDLNEWFFHEILKDQGILALRYKFVQAYINDVNVGIYAIEENYRKELIENNKRRSGVTFRFNCSKYWHYKYGAHPDRLIGAPIEPYSIGDLTEENPLFQQFLTAKALIERWTTGELKLGEVFDLGLLAKYFSVVDLYGGQHGAWLDNMKFYYNPVTSLIEPIGHDNSTMVYLASSKLLDGRKLLGERRLLTTEEEPMNFNELNSDFINLWYDRIFADEEFYKHYIGSLESISNEHWLNSFLDTLAPKLADAERIIGVNQPNYKFSGADVIKANAKFIRGFLTPPNGIETYLAEVDTTTGKVAFQVRNTHFSPFYINQIFYKDSVIHQLEKPILVQSNSKSANTAVEFELVLPQILVRKKKFTERVKVGYSMIGGTEAFVSTPFPWSESSFAKATAILKARKSNYNEFSFLEIKSESVTIPAGKWTISKLLTIDASKALLVLPGADITLTNGASILCYGGVEMIGTSHNPISIHAKNEGQGLAVINSKKHSQLSNVNFFGLQRFKIDSWELPASVTFYNSNVTIDQCKFEKNLVGDDYLNIFRSEFMLSNSEFKNCLADAFDGDFINGTINQVTFNNVGNDGIDFSGSSIKVNKVSFNGVGDKAISVGERSQLSAQNVSIINAEIGINSKDASVVNVSETTIDSTRIPLIAFMKKAEYGASSIYAENVTMRNFESSYMLEGKSQIVIDGEVKPATHENVKSLLYGAEFGKSSK
jgi:hypothetical protein